MSEITARISMSIVWVFFCLLVAVLFSKGNETQLFTIWLIGSVFTVYKELTHKKDIKRC